MKTTKSRHSGVELVVINLFTRLKKSISESGKSHKVLKDCRETELTDPKFMNI
jgi:hypothetical protein